MSTDLPDYDTVADLLLPLDGPHDPARVRAAAHLLAELVRRLNHATGAARVTSLRYPSDVASVLGSIESALGRLPQLVRQLGHRLRSFSGDPATAVDDLGPPMEPYIAIGRATADLAEAIPMLTAAADLVRAAHGPANRLSYDDRKETS